MAGPTPSVASAAFINDTITIRADFGNDNTDLTQTITVPRAGRIIDITVWNVFSSPATLDVKLGAFNVAPQFAGSGILRASDLDITAVDVAAGDTLNIVRSTANANDVFAVYITFFAPGVPVKSVTA
jgi:hypothetical protein